MLKTDDRQTEEFTGNFIIPISASEAVRLSQDDYRSLIEDGGISHRNPAIIIAAAQILAELGPEPKSFRRVVGAIHENPEAIPTVTERRAVAALVQANLIARHGSRFATRYSYSGSRVS